MSNVYFENEDKEARQLRGYSYADDLQKTSPLAQFLIDKKIVPDKEWANKVLLGLVVFFIILTIFISSGGISAISGGNSDVVTLPDGRKIPFKQYVEGVKSGLYQQ